MKGLTKKRTYWCDTCQIPLIGEVCHACGQTGRDIATAALVPVFRPEINFLRKRISPELQGLLHETETWVTPGNCTYYSLGKSLFRVSASTGDQATISRANERIKLNRNRSKESWLSIFRKANGPYVEKLQYEAQQFIQQTVQKYPARQILVSFSGGKDSTVVSHLVMNALGRSDVLHIFADTSIEMPDTYTFLKEFQKEHPLTPFIVSRSPLNFFNTAKRIGPPSRILRWCCTTHKTNPLSKIIHSLSPGKGVLTFDGVRKVESARRSKYERITKKHKIEDEVLASPIIEWSDLSVWAYILFHRMHFNKAYARGFRRVGCLYCPFNSEWSNLMIETHYPRQHRIWQRFLIGQAKTMGHPDPSEFASKRWRARAGGRGLDHYKTTIESAPCLLSDSAVSYQLLSGNIDHLRQFLRPFGPQTWIRENGNAEVFLIHNNRTNELLASVEIGLKDNEFRINYLVGKGGYVFRKRVEKQLKKLQSCIFCGSCAEKCPARAICVMGKMYSIDNNLCVSCLDCVKYRCPSVESLIKKGK